MSHKAKWARNVIQLLTKKKKKWFQTILGMFLLSSCCHLPHPELVLDVWIQSHFGWPELTRIFQHPGSPLTTVLEIILEMQVLQIWTVTSLKFTDTEERIANIFSPEECLIHVKLQLQRRWEDSDWEARASEGIQFPSLVPGAVDVIPQDCVFLLELQCRFQAVPCK